MYGAFCENQNHFIQAVVMLAGRYSCTTWTLMKCLKKKQGWDNTMMLTCCFEQILEAATHNTTAVRPLTSHLTNYSNRMNKICWSLLVK